MKLSGIIGYPVTPFKEDNTGVDLQKLKHVIDVLLEAKSDAIATLGSAGEAAYLSEANGSWLQISRLSMLRAVCPLSLALHSLPPTKR